MHPDNLNKTIIGGHLKWHKEENGTYTQSVTFIYKDGERDEDIIRNNVSEKEYFIRSLNGTKNEWTSHSLSRRTSNEWTKMIIN